MKPRELNMRRKPDGVTELTLVLAAHLELDALRAVLELQAEVDQRLRKLSRRPTTRVST